jgi:soluble lytic murein transglycosylase-like protein
MRYPVVALLVCWLVLGAARPALASETVGVASVPPRALEPDVPTLIVDAAARWGLSSERMLRVAWCESRWDPAARSGGGHAGVFQFAPQTWAWASSAVGHAEESPFHAAANVEAAAWLMATQGFHHWECR